LLSLDELFYDTKLSKASLFNDGGGHEESHQQGDHFEVHQMYLWLRNPDYETLLDYSDNDDLVLSYPALTNTNILHDHFIDSTLHSLYEATK
jgi:hypothetical protein